MRLSLKLNRRIHLVIHIIGLSCLAAALWLQAIVFSSILREGYFRAAEKSRFILSFEIALTVVSVIYFFYIYQKIIRSSLK